MFVARSLADSDYCGARSPRDRYHQPIRGVRDLPVIGGQHAIRRSRLGMLPAVAVRQFVPRHARIIDANDQTPTGHGIRTTVNTRAGSRPGARCLAAPSHVGGWEHDLLVICPMQELRRRLQHTKATPSPRDMKTGRRNALRGRCQGLRDDEGSAGACLDRADARRAARRRMTGCDRLAILDR